MEMDWEALLDELWSYAVSDPKKLETKIRSCLKGHSSEGLLQAISLLITQEQHATARTLLTEFLKNHQSADNIQRRLELILHFKKNRAPQMLSSMSTQRSKEQLIKDVNDLVASGNLQAAESLLLEASDTFEDPDALSLLSRVYVLQRRPIDGAKAMKRALHLRRKQQAFVGTESKKTIDDLPTQLDLAFLSDSAACLIDLDSPTFPVNEALTETANDSLAFIQHTASRYPTLKTDSWWEGQSESTPSEASTCLNNLEVVGVTDSAQAITDAPPERHITKNEKAAPASIRNVLKLAHSRKETETGEVLVKVKVFKKSGCSLISVSYPELRTSEPSTTDKPPLQQTLSPPPEPPAAAPEVHNKTSEDENEDEDEDEDEEYLPLTNLELNTPSPPQQYLDLEDTEDPIDLDYDLQDLSIFELGAGQEEDAHKVVDGFHELEDNYAAYVFDPNEVFDDAEYLAAESNDGAANRLSREDRALQVAAELIAKANWPLSTLSLIQQIFVMSGWGSTRIAIEREIEKKLTPDELILAAHIKVIWSENDIYWISFDKTGSSRLSHYVLSWPTALLIVRSFESLPHVEEIEVLIENLFTSWYESTTLRHAFKAFARYLWFRFANLKGCLPADQPFDFCSTHELPDDEYSELGLCDPMECEKNQTLRAYGVFQSKHPQEPGCYFSDKPPIRETSSLKAGKHSKKQTENAEMFGDIQAEAGSINDDDVAPHQRSEAPHASALQAHNTDQPSPSIEP